MARMFAVERWPASGCLLAVVLALGFNGVATVRAQTPDEQQIARLIEQLGSRSFSEREQATEELLSLGMAALPRLRDVESQDAELLDRARMVTARIEQTRFAQLSKSFLRDPDASRSYGLPSWQAYRELAGSSRASKLLFLDMIQQQPELCSLIERASGDPLPKALSALRELTTYQSVELTRNRLDRLQTPEIGDIAAILLATAKSDGQAPVEVSEWLTMSAQVVPVTTYMQRRGYAEAIRNLYAAWIPKTHEAMAYSALDLSMRYELETGTVVARRNLSPHLDFRLRELSILVLARFGTQEDVASLVPFFEDETLCQEYPKPRRLPTSNARILEADEAPPGADPAALTEQQLVRYRICDLALAAALLLTGDDLQQAFPYFVPGEGRELDVRGVVVDSNEEQLALRRATLEAYKQQLGGVANES